MVNLVILVGRLGREPELSYTGSGNAVVNFSLATESRWRDAEGTERMATEWHRIEAWNGTAEACEKYLTVGRLVYIEGHLHTKRFEQNKIKVSKTYVVVDEIKFLPTSKATPRPTFEEEELLTDLKGAVEE